MKSRVCAFIHSDEIERYHYPPDCPFKTERAGETRRILRSMGYYTDPGRIEVAPVAALPQELRLFHTEAYLETLSRVSRGDISPEDLASGIGTADCPVFSDLYAYAALATGGSLTGARLLLDGAADIVFNPSGGLHHALSDKAGGFCYVNDVVIACKILAAAKKRVFCLDLDAHHGNGTQAAFYDDPRVFTVSFHESGETLYPWGGFETEIGEGKGLGYNLNMPFPAGTDDAAYARAFDLLVPPLVKAYDPDVIVLEIGMDILQVDPLTHLAMTNNGIADLLPAILAFDKPLLVVGGGGYSPHDTARGWALAWCLLSGVEMEEDLNMGLGGVFLGSAEWHAGLRDKRAYAQGQEKIAINQKIDKSVEILRKTVFPYHDIE